jgi:CubicO group peptidase (beta-lactamase class C family)
MNAYFSRLIILLLILMLTACSTSNTEKPTSSEANKEIEQKKAVEIVTPNTETPQTEVPKSDLEQKLDTLMETTDFSGSILLVKDNKVKIAKGYNMANSENKQLNGPDTVFRIASLTKAFTAASILQLQEQGKLNVYDPVMKYIKGYPYKKVTLYELLTHTAGIPNFTEFQNFTSTMNLPTSVSDNMAKFIDMPLDFEPGSQFKYSNSGYILLGAVIESVSGQSYNDYIHDHIFVPLGMERSGNLDIDRISDQIAVGYSMVDGQWKQDVEIDLSVVHAAGGIYSTVNDLNKWIQGLENGKILNAASWKAMLTPNKEGYALGWGSFEQETVYQHSGAFDGFSSLINRNLTKGTAVILLSNLEGINVFDYLNDLSTMLESE